jgi:hypothetical protein
VDSEILKQIGIRRGDCAAGAAMLLDLYIYGALDGRQFGIAFHLFICFTS